MLISGTNRRWWVLAGTCFGLFLLMLDSTIVNLALPDIQGDLGASDSELQWIMNAYLLVMAAMVVSAGRVGDILGRKRVFQAGLVVFMAGSVVSATAVDPIVLIGGRVVQAFGGSALLALSLAIVSRAFEDHDRARALGIWASVSAIALAVGPLLGGVLVDDLSWRGIFWINLPIGVVGLVVTGVAAEETRDETAGSHIDVPGLITLALGLSLVVGALVQGADWGWESTATILTLASGAAVLVVFCLVERRVRQPIVDFALFRNGPYLGASAAGFALVGTFWVLIFYEPQYLENILGHSALEAGLLVLPITAPMIVISPLTGRLTGLVGTRALITAGMAAGTAGVVVLTQVGTGTGYGLLLVGYLLFGIALGLVYATMSTAAMEAMPSDKAGIASGVLGMNRLLAGALLLALSGALVQHFGQERLATQSGAGAGAVTQTADAFTYALSRALWLVVAVMAAGTVLTALFVRGTRAVRVPAPELREHHVRRVHL